MKAPIGQAVLVAVVGSAVHALLFLVVDGWMACVVPGYRREFADYAIRLPWITEAVIHVSTWFCNYWYVVALVLPPLLVLDGGVLLLAWLKSGTRILGVLWFLLVAMVPTLFMMIASFSLWLAYNKLLENLSR
jgi:type II secretory pathway component PulF